MSYLTAIENQEWRKQRDGNQNGRERQNKKAARWRAAKGPELGGNALCYAN
jgi:hypothetical protein